jgi:hypothetical protein
VPLVDAFGPKIAFETWFARSPNSWDCSSDAKSCACVSGFVAFEFLVLREIRKR